MVAGKVAKYEGRASYDIHLATTVPRRYCEHHECRQRGLD